MYGHFLAAIEIVCEDFCYRLMILCAEESVICPMSITVLANSLNKDHDCREAMGKFYCSIQLFLLI